MAELLSFVCTSLFTKSISSQFYIMHPRKCFVCTNKDSHLEGKCIIADYGLNSQKYSGWLLPKGSALVLNEFVITKQGVFFSAYTRISADFPRIFYPPEISTNLGRK